MNTFPRLAVLALFSALLLTGCAATTNAPANDPTAVPSTTATSSPIDVDASFRTIADDSCDTAYSDGVVEQSADGVMFLVPEEQSYQDYSAAFDSESDGIGVIWSTEVFFACAASIGYQMSADGGSEYPIELSFDEATGDYRAILDVEDYGTLDYTYSVRDGLFTAVDWVSPEESGSTTITYGSPSDELVDILHLAVDEFLADQG